MSYLSYGFPLATLDPGCEQEISVPITDVFRPQKLMMVGQMDKIRGSFWVKRSRLPRLDRDDVCAYSTVHRQPWRQRTVIAFTQSSTGRRVARTYLPESVVYNHVDPLHYITLDQMKVDEERVLAAVGGSGIPAEVFGEAALGSGIPLPTSRGRIMISLRNRGDIQVRVHAAMIGYGMAPPQAEARP